MACCEPGPTRHSDHGCCDCAPTCCTPHGFSRRFISSQERQGLLEQYKEQLEKEIAGVKERIQELKGGCN
jgi:hypothetical protein